MPPTVERFSLVSTDVDEMQAFGRAYFYPRRFLRPLQRSGRLSARYALLRAGPLTIAEGSYGAEVTFGYAEPDFYLGSVVLDGHLLARQGSRVLVGTVADPAIFQAGQDIVMDYWSAECRALAVKIDRPVLERQLQNLLDAPVRTPLELPGRFDPGTGYGRSWAALIRMVAGEFDNDTGMLDHPLIAGHLWDTVTIGLLLGTDHPYREELLRPGHAYRPEPVRRAIDAIQAHPEHQFTLAGIADAAGVSVRTLQAGFRRYVGSSPIAYLRHVRLARVHADLRAADPRLTTVAEIAYRWGFAHLGRFAAAYQARYGTPPSHTLYTP